MSSSNSGRIDYTLNIINVDFGGASIEVVPIESDKCATIDSAIIRANSINDWSTNSGIGDGPIQGELIVAVSEYGIGGE